MQSKRGFTLFEIIIAIVIIGVLAGLALPRFARLVEGVRVAEAVRSIEIIKNAMTRCYLMGGSTFQGCTMSSLGIDDPGAAAGTHFIYNIIPGGQTYLIQATRNAADGGGSHVNKLVMMGYGLKVSIDENGTSYQISQTLNDGRQYWSAAVPYKSMLLGGSEDSGVGT